MLGAAHVIVADIGRVGSPPLTPTIGVSPRGVIAFQRGGDLTSVRRRWVDRSGIPLDTTELAVNGPSASLSANGRYLAFDDNRTGVGRDVWIMDLARQVTSRLTPDGENASSPVWTPDDRHVIYRRGERIYAKASDAATAEAVIGELKGRPLSPDASRTVLRRSESNAHGCQCSAESEIGSRSAPGIVSVGGTVRNRRLHRRGRRTALSRHSSSPGRNRCANHGRDELVGGAPGAIGSPLESRV